MPKADFFQRLGLFAVPRFFDPTFCAAVRVEMRAAAHVAGTVDVGEGDAPVDLKTRSVQWARMREETTALITSRFTELKPQLERHFNVTLTGSQRPQFLTYRSGDFYRAHHDNMPARADFVRERQISVVVFLNRMSNAPQPDCHTGGALTFYGLFDDPAMDTLGFPLESEEGTLIAFRSEVLHGVAPVTSGERYTIATWFR